MATTTRTNASKAVAKQAKPQVKKPEPPALPEVQADLGRREVEYFFPSLQLPGNVRISCSHVRYGHESERAARKCLSALAAQHKVQLVK